MSKKIFRLVTSGLLCAGTLGLTPAAADLSGAWPGLSTLPAYAEDVEEAVNVRVYELASPSVVSIETQNRSGSGSIVSSDGLILTNAHVVEDEASVTVLLSDGTEYQAEVVGIADLGLDLAAVQIVNPPASLPTITIAPPNSVQVGQRAFAIGNPFGFQGTLTTGIVSRVDRDRGMIQTDAAINPGNSGGPLLDTQGRLIGVNTINYSPDGSGNIGIGFAIPVERLQPFLTAVREGRAERTAQRSRPVAPPTAQTIPVDGDPISGRLTVQSNVLPGDSSYYDAYTFQGSRGQQVEITMTSRQLDSYLILLAPNGTDLAQDDDGAGGTNSKIQVTLPEDGTYTILANSYAPWEVGAYNLSLSNLQSNAARPNATQPVPSAQPVLQTPQQQGYLLDEQGELGPASHVLSSDNSLYEEHYFEGRAGQTVTVMLQSNDFDTYLILVDPAGNVVGENDDMEPDNYNSALTVTLPQNGTYRVIANSYDQTGRGNYTITVR